MSVDRRAEKKRKLEERRKLEREQGTVSQEKQLKVTVTPPSRFNDAVSEKEDALINGQLYLSKLNKTLGALDMPLDDFLTQQGVQLSKPKRTVKTPYGDYSVATSYLSYEQLKQHCVIDPDNVRDESERTEAALQDIIDEIGAGLQTTPIVAYIDNNGRSSIAEGSRRYQCAMLRHVGLDVDYFSPKPTPEVVKWLVEASDKKVKFSYYDKGKLFTSLMKQHNWTQAELSRQRQYSKQEIFRCCRFFDAPKMLLNKLPTKNLTQTLVDKFISTVSKLEDAGMVDEAVEYLSSIQYKEGATAKEQAKVVVNKVEEFSKQFVQGKKQTDRNKPTFTFGDSELYISRSKVGSNLNLKKIPRDKEDTIIEAIQAILSK